MVTRGETGNRRHAASPRFRRDGSQRV